MAKDKKQKDISINDLAVMMAKGFANVDKRFEGVDKRLDGMDKRFDGMDKRFEALENSLGGFRKEVNEKLDRLEVKTDWTLKYAENIDKELQKLQKNTERKETRYVTKSSLRKIAGKGD